jgi:hypothetical protein
MGVRELRDFAEADGIAHCQVDALHLVGDGSSSARLARGYARAVQTQRVIGCGLSDPLVATIAIPNVLKPCPFPSGREI